MNDVSTYAEQLTDQDHLNLYRHLTLVRTFEEKIREYHHKKSPVTELPHLSTGQEAVSVGSCYGLRSDDVIVPSLRTRGAFLMRGVSPKVSMAGMFGKATGLTKGRNTSHHAGSMALNIVPGSGVVGSHLPLGAGVALAAKTLKKDFVTLVYFGDGASNRGDFHEALNFAAVLKLPVIFICENNQWALSNPVTQHILIKNVAERAASYGMPGYTIDGNDVLDVYNCTMKAVEVARRGDGPSLIECKTYRWHAHSERDPRDMRTKEEIESWKQKCPLKRYEAFLIGKSVSQAVLAAIQADVAKEIDEAVVFSETSPYPQVDEMYKNVYFEGE